MRIFWFASEAMPLDADLDGFCAQLRAAEPDPVGADGAVGLLVIWVAALHEFMALPLDAYGVSQMASDNPEDGFSYAFFMSQSLERQFSGDDCAGARLLY